MLLFNEPVSKLELIDDKSYNPNASTPLYDAMGFSIEKLKKVLEKVKDFNVLVTILTDGEENASREYTGPAIKVLVEELKQQRWTFTYIGTDHDVEKFAATISITNTMSFNKNDADIKIMFMKESHARKKYSEKISKEEDTGDDFYEENEKKE